ncbi:glycosyltransferase family 2 protein [Gemmatimonas aurantiaca]|nr:glycosyltransferase family 2 protein [Gemmatimonas aurantiaca]
MDETSASGPSVQSIKISIVTVTYNSETALREGLPSWRAALHYFSDQGFGAWELVVVDNGSSDSSVELAGEFDDKSSVISLGENRGFAAGCNVGAAKASGEILLFLNPDVILDHEALAELSAALMKLSDAGAVCGRMRNRDGTFQSTCRNVPTALNIFASRGSLIGRLFPDLTYTLPDSAKPVAVPAAAATCLAMKRSFFNELGGFDERFFMYFEDTDLSLRILESGKKVYFIPTAGAVHSWGGSSGLSNSSAGSRVLPSARARWHHRSALRFFRKHHPGFFSWIILPLALACNLTLSSLLRRFGVPQ